MNVVVVDKIFLEGCTGSKNCADGEYVDKEEKKEDGRGKAADPTMILFQVSKASEQQ